MATTELQKKDFVQVWEPGARLERSQPLAPGRNWEGSRQRDPPGREKGAGDSSESERAVEPFLATVLGRGPGCSRRVGSHWEECAREESGFYLKLGERAPGSKARESSPHRWPGELGQGQATGYKGNHGEQEQSSVTVREKADRL